jgi:hypothetical protein
MVKEKEMANRLFEALRPEYAALLPAVRVDTDRQHACGARRRGA